MAVKVRSSNLVHPWSWVTWQVYAGIRLTGKALSGSGVRQTQTEVKDKGDSEGQQSDTLNMLQLSKTWNYFLFLLKLEFEVK